MKAALLSLLLACVFASTAVAKPGDLDTSFGTAGTGRVAIGFPVPAGNPAASENASGIALTPDGHIVVAGYRQVGAVGAPDFVVARLTAAGVLDSAYGGGSGGSIFGFPAAPGVTTLDDFGRAVVVQRDGKIVAVGDSDARGSYDLAAARLVSPQGTLDPAYGTGGNGTATVASYGGVTAAGTDEFAFGAAVAGDGRVVIAGVRENASTFHDFAVARLTSSGGADSAGTIDYPPAAGVPGSDDYASGVAIAPDGRIVVAGTTNATGAGDVAVVRLTPGFLLDSSFAGGRGRFDLGGSDDRGNAVALQPDGKVVVAGASNAKGAPEFAAMRLTAGGAKDGSFGGGTGAAFTGVAGEALAVAVQANGKILLAGGSGNNMVVVRLQPNGALDTSFGTGGRAIVDMGGLEDAVGLALQPDGKILVAGSTTAGGSDDLAVARLQGDPPGADGGGGGGGPTGEQPRCAGKRATIVGTPGKDKLRGTRRADVIVGLGGNDSISGLGGNDVVCAGDGKDKLLGGDGKDRLDGGDGNDALDGGAGNDSANGGAGNDSVKGGSGNDRVLGGSGKDKLSGAAGNDTLDGGSGNDSEDGGNGNDSVKGGSGTDRLLGGAGKDKLAGGTGRDRLVGGPGADKQKQ